MSIWVCGIFLLFSLPPIYQESCFTISQYSLVDFHYCMKNVVTSQLLNFTKGRINRQSPIFFILTKTSFLAILYKYTVTVTVFELTQFDILILIVEVIVTLIFMNQQDVPTASAQNCIQNGSISLWEDSTATYTFWYKITLIRPVEVVEFVVVVVVVVVVDEGRTHTHTQG